MLIKTLSRVLHLSLLKSSAPFATVPLHMTTVGITAAQDWNADNYQLQHSFVYKYGASLVDLLDPQPGERVLDLGCGTGELTLEIARRGAIAIGIDADATMIARAVASVADAPQEQEFLTNVDFKHADARTFTLPEGPVDAIFSNAALHWVPEAERCIVRMAAALRPKGRLVVEFGGKNNIHEIASFLDRTCGKDKNPWYYPSIGEYATLLEKHGIEVVSAELYDRPTPLIGEDGLRNWISMFAGPYLESITDREELFRQADAELRPKLHNGDRWVADYRRIRIVGKRLQY
ncbi:Methyltransferase type 11 [Fragilaria crotonensis]|nr:Methyltransferase type 11 [Fragilaria crotonensis]